MEENEYPFSRYLYRLQVYGSQSLILASLICLVSNRKRWKYIFSFTTGVCLGFLNRDLIACWKELTKHKNKLI
jgi:hypothetical protein